MSTDRAQLINKRALYDGRTWGDWRFVANNLTLLFFLDGGGKYEVDLESIQDSASMLDWIFHLKEKEAWVTDKVMGDFLRAVNYILDPRANLCPVSKGNKTIDPTERIKKLLSQ